MPRTKFPEKEMRKLARRGTTVRSTDDRVKRVHNRDRLIPTGSTLLNCALSDNPFGGWSIGKIANLIGDSQAGKTVVALTTLAEMANDPRFKEYELIYDDVEQAGEFDIPYMFGTKTARRIRAPRYDQEGGAVYSDTVQDLHMNILSAVGKGTPFIYIVDSFDALDSEEDQKQIQEEMKAREKGNKVSGSYGTAKAKHASSILRNIKKKIKETESAVIVVSQTRDDINPMTMTKKTRSGGRALKFYSCHELWMAIIKALGTEQKSSKRSKGNMVNVKVSKNKLTGKKCEVSFPIYWDLGERCGAMDDIDSCITFLIEEGHWKLTKQTINAHDFDFRGTKQKTIQFIEENGLHRKLQRIVGDVWNEAYEALRIRGRKGRYE